MSDPTGRLNRLSDADLWEQYRDQGLSAEEATHHVQLRAVANQGPAIAEQETAQIQDVGPAATAAQNAIDWSPAATLNLPTALLRMASPPDKPGSWRLLASRKGLADFLPSDPLGSVEAKASGLSYEDFQKAKGVSDEASPTAALIGKAGGIAAGPLAAIGARLGARASVTSATKAAGLEYQQLQNEALRRSLGERLGGLPETPPTASPAEVAAMRQFDLPLEQVRGRLGDRPAALGGGNPAPTAEQLAAIEARRQAAMASTPSRVAPTVPESPAAGPQASPSAPVVPPAAVPPAGAVKPAPSQAPILPALRAAADPMETTPAYVRSGNPRTLPYFPRGGAAEQARAPGPVSSMPGSPQRMVDASLPLAKALDPESFTGGGFSGVAAAMRQPAYQRADVLAGQAVRLGIGPFKGLSIPDATRLLQKMILDKVQAGGSIPPITTVPKFLQGLGT